jgi:hypothetical protein
LYEDMGIGWTLGHFNGVKTVSHGGMGFGWTDFLVILPEKDCAAVILCNEESYARSRTVRAVLDTMLGQHPQVGKVSWMVPISRSLAAGGIQAAYACYAELKTSGAEEYIFDEDDLPNLAIQLVSANKIALAIEVLELNNYVFPEHVESYVARGLLHLRQGENAPAEICLLKALSVEPENHVAAELVKNINSR